MRSRAKRISAGRRFGFLIILQRAENIGKAAAWKCRCICGNELVVRGNTLRSGDKISCGRKHYRGAMIDDVAPAEVRAWRAMINRCHHKKDWKYRIYGALGVKVCDRWYNSVENFISDMGPRPSEKHSIDRYPDPFGNYEPTNCRWATAKEQARNKRSTVKVEVNGKQIPLTQHLEGLDVTEWLVRKRLRQGWTIDDAINTRYLGRPIVGKSRVTRAHLQQKLHDELVRLVPSLAAEEFIKPAWKDPTGWIITTSLDPK